LFDNDKNIYALDEFPKLYHERWDIGELYKISKALIEVQDFHAQSERGVKQEPFAHFVMITLSRDQVPWFFTGPRLPSFPSLV